MTVSGSADLQHGQTHLDTLQSTLGVVWGLAHENAVAAFQQLEGLVAKRKAAVLQEIQAGYKSEIDSLQRRAVRTSSSA